MMLDIKVTQKMPQEAVMHALVMYKMQEQGVEGGGGREEGQEKRGEGKPWLRTWGGGEGEVASP